MLRSELERFISEDLGEWDDSSTFIPEKDACAIVLAKENCIISGLAEAKEVLEYFGLDGELLYGDGDTVPAESIVLVVRGSARKILQAERLVLNFLARMSGISTITRECVKQAHGIRVAGTRKTTPGFRMHEKRAISLGGGDPHRFNLSDSILIKDNHIKLLGLEECIRAAKIRASFTKKIEVEVEDLDSMMKAAKLGVDIIMFDNMTPSEIKKGIQLLRDEGIRDHLFLEASGNITLENLLDFAKSGVDAVSMGSLTRNARWIDFSLEME